MVALTSISKNHDFEHYLLTERANSMSKQRTVSLLSEVGICLLTLAVVWGKFLSYQLIVWFIVSVGAALLSWYCHQDIEEGRRGFSSRYWLRRSAFCFFLSGLLWGMVPWFFFAQEYSVFLIWVYAGYVAGVMCVSIAYTPSFLMFALGISLPFATRLLVEGGDQYQLMSLQLAFYVAMLTFVSVNMQKLFLVSTRSNFENILYMQQLAQEKETALNAVRSKDQFLAAASHDLRQPLNAMSLFIDTLSNKNLDHSGSSAVVKIRQSIRALNSMLHGLLSIAQLNSSSLQNNPVHLLINSLVDQVQDEYRQIAEKKGVRIINRIASEQVVLADKLLLERVVRNLVDNAIKYTSDAPVVIYGEQPDGEFVLTIKDSGIGIPFDQQENIYDEFYQLNNPSRDRQKGLGLGLAIVKRICSLMGASLQLESKVGVGSKFQLSLPVGDASLVFQEGSPPDVKLEGLTVLVIDDEEDILDGMQRVLSDWGCHPVLAASHDQALQLLTHQTLVPDLIITDFRLRETASGIDVANALREEFNMHTPVILITGETSPRQVKEAFLADVVVMYKPIDSNDLENVIKQLMFSWQQELAN